VRYVAVEVGIGGYRPAPPLDVMTRRWGDCKDKSVLLVDLLNAAGIEAYPVVHPSGPQGRVDPEFPAVDGFNHFIVAVSTAGLEVTPDDPVAGDFLFIDATETLARPTGCRRRSRTRRRWSCAANRASSSTLRSRRPPSRGSWR